MKEKILSAFLSLVILLSLAGCGNQEQIKANESDRSSQTDLTDILSDNDTSGNVTAESVDTVKPDSMSETEPEGTTEKDNQNPFTMNANNQKPKVSNPSATKPHQDAGTDKPAEASIQKQTEPPAPTKTESSETEKAPAPTKPSEKPTTKPTEPEFDINYWISFAQNYAKSVGLRLESSAVDCWDNPIPANAKCKYLERDIKSRLNRYAKDEDITDVWIWAEKVSDNSYEIYIGYA